MLLYTPIPILQRFPQNLSLRIFPFVNHIYYCLVTAISRTIPMYILD